jgi:ribonuclease ZC3H12
VDSLLILRDIEKLASGIPNFVYDDSFIIDFAKKKNAFILTNDRYNDHINNYSKNDLEVRL